ncbi:MAG: MarR family EPS-associated transcriptional regulator [Spirochaetota bacterium]
MVEHSYKIITVIEKHPEYTQRKIAQELGYSLGKVNYIIASLADKGLIKWQRFMKSKHKAGYRYILTPRGIKAKYNITRAFIKKKMKEYDIIAREIEEARKSIQAEEA